MKKILLVLFFVWISQVHAAPAILCEWLPGCDDTSYDSVIGRLSGFVADILIQYVAVAAVIALMISGMMYLVSGGEEEKVKKAKTWIIWSLIWVFLSVAAWYIINIINNISF